MTTISTAVTVTTASPLRAIKLEVYRLMGISPTAKRPSKAVKDVYGCDLRYRANWETILTLEQGKGLNVVRDTLETKLDTVDAFGSELNTSPINQPRIELPTGALTDLDLNQFAITVISESQHIVKWYDQVTGVIKPSPKGSQWEYVRYSRYPETFTGTYFECCDRAIQDFENTREPLHSVINTNYSPLSTWCWMHRPKTHIVLNDLFMGSRSEMDDSINV